MSASPLVWSHYAGMMSAGSINKRAVARLARMPDLLSSQQGRAGRFFIDASLFGPGFEDPDASAVAGKTGLRRHAASRRGRRFLDGPLDVGHRHPCQTLTNPEAAWYFIQWMTSRGH